MEIDTLMFTICLMSLLIFFYFGLLHSDENDLKKNSASKWCNKKVFVLASGDNEFDSQYFHSHL